MLTLTLSKDQLRVEPGSAATVAITVQNKGQSAERVELDVNGLDGDWIAIPMPSFNLAPGEERSEKILIKPPRAAESKSGAYPFAVRVRSLESGLGTEAPGVLEVEPFHLVSLEVEPKRGVAGYPKKAASFSVTAINLGNIEQNLQLFADDPEDGCTYQFDSERVQLAPGQQKSIGLSVQPTHVPLIGSTRLYGFAVSARSVENPLVVANAQAQVERRALVTPTVLLVTLAILLIGSLWYARRPVLPTLNSFSSSAPDVLRGTAVTLYWATSNANSVTIEGSSLTQPYKQLQPTGRIDVVLNTTTTFKAYAVNDVGTSKQAQELTVTVRDPVQIALPDIVSFRLSPRSAKIGDTVKVEYEVRNASKIVLQPDRIDLPVDQNSFLLNTTQAGEKEYMLVAYNSEGKTVTKKYTIHVVQPSDARILSFQAQVDGKKLGKTEIEPLTRVTLAWQVSGAERVELEPGLGKLTGTEGTVDVNPDKTTTYILTATDSKGIAVTQKITVKVKLPTPPPDEGPPPVS